MILGWLPWRLMRSLLPVVSLCAHVHALLACRPQLGPGWSPTCPPGVDCCAVRSKATCRTLLADAHPSACPAMPADAAAAGDNVWAGWLPASTGDGETTAAEMRQKLRAKQQREQAAAAKQRRHEEEIKEEESMVREKTIGTGAWLAAWLPAWITHAYVALRCAFELGLKSLPMLGLKSPPF